jgi:hypothetical protein
MYGGEIEIYYSNGLSVLSAPSHWYLLIQKSVFFCVRVYHFDDDEGYKTSLIPIAHTTKAPTANTNEALSLSSSKEFQRR